MTFALDRSASWPIDGGASIIELFNADSVPTMYEVEALKVWSLNCEPVLRQPV